MPERRARTAAVAVAVGVAIGATACSSGSNTATTATTAAPAPVAPVTAVAPTTSAPSGPQAFTVKGFDYEFDGLPDTMAAGSSLAFSNTSTKEAHELAVFRLPDTDTHTISDFATMPMEQLQQTVPGPPIMVWVAGPSAQGMLTVGNGTITMPGRYLAICEVPTGADPSAYVAAANQAKGAAVSVPGGAPHYMDGMLQPFTVT
jgi:hypothetical protein